MRSRINIAHLLQRPRQRLPRQGHFGNAVHTARAGLNRQQFSAQCTLVYTMKLQVSIHSIVCISLLSKSGARARFQLWRFMLQRANNGLFNYKCVEIRSRFAAQSQLALSWQQQQHCCGSSTKGTAAAAAAADQPSSSPSSCAQLWLGTD